MKFRNTVLISFFIVVPSTIVTSASAQKDESGSVGIFNSRQEYHEFFGGLKQLNDPEINAMLPTLNDIVLGKPIGDTAMAHGAGKGNLIDMLGDPRVRKDLDMVDSQYEELKELNRGFQSQVADQMKSLDLSDSKGIIDTIGKITASAESQFERVLLPHQIERLRQLAVRNQIRRRSLVDVITTDPVAAELDISEQQKTGIREAEKEINAELEREIEHLRMKAREKLLSKLKRRQRDKLNELLGDEFQFTESGKSRGKAKPEK